MLKYEQLAGAYNSVDLLKIIGSLHLLPQNHGKYVRLSTLLKIALSTFSESSKSVPINELVASIGNEFPNSEDEDLPVNHFTENIVFYNGNHVVFPGIKEDGTNILNKLLITIFFVPGDNNLPKPFVENVSAAAKLILGLANFSASQCGLTRNYSEKIKESKIEFPPVAKIEQYKNAITYHLDWISEYCDRNSIPAGVVEHFVLDTKANPEEYTTLLYSYPLAKVGSEYIFLQISSSVSCLIQFIWDEAKKNGCFESLLNLYRDYQWLDTQRLVSQIYGPPLAIDLPTKTLRCRELIFPFDLNKLAYVCFIENDLEITSKSDQGQLENALNECAKEIEDRREEVFNFLSTDAGLEENNFFTIYILSEAGFRQPYSLPSPKENRLGVWFRASELKSICDLESPDPLLFWKFAKSFLEITGECDFSYAGGLLDVFAAFREYDDSLWPVDNERPGLLMVTPGHSQNYVRAAILKRDEHLAPIISAGRVIEVLVYNYCSYAAFYMRVGDVTPAPILFEDFTFPIWFFNEQSGTHNAALIQPHLEAFAFRINQLKPEVEKYFTRSNTSEVLVINIIFDARFKQEMKPEDIVVFPLEKIDIPVTILEKQINLTVPVELAYWYAQPNNAGERKLILILLDAIIKIKTGFTKFSELKAIIDKVIPLSHAKLLTILGNANTVPLETRFLPPYRPIQQYELSRIKTNLTRDYGISITPNDLLNAQNKTKLCRKISETLHARLTEKLFRFDQSKLLPILIGINEACVQQRATRALDLPAKLTAFSSIPHEIVTLFEKEQERVKTALAARSLIELIVGKDSQSGKLSPSLDEIDELIAMMHEMISWAWLSDGIHMGLHDPQIKVLACGRIDVDYPSINAKMLPFGVTKSEIEVHQVIDNYENIFSTPAFDPTTPYPAEAEKIEEAFKSTWGIGLIRLQDFIIDLSNFTRRNNSSIVAIARPILFNKLKETSQKWSEEEIDAALSILVLPSAWEIGKAPEGFKKTDTYPWYYNRALSFIRRPIAKLTEAPETIYYWSYRSLFASFDNLLSLFFSGGLQVEEGSKLDELVKEQRTKKGDAFRSEVAHWLGEQIGLEVIPGEVDIKPGAKLDASENLGDIDVLLFDQENRMIYPIECKNTVDSRAIHEMKTEIDKYLGRDGKPGMIQKHVDRHKWLKGNQPALAAYIQNPDLYTVKSLILTSEEIPLAYIKKEELPIPLTSFPKLKLIKGKGLRSFLKDLK